MNRQKFDKNLSGKSPCVTLKQLIQWKEEVKKRFSNRIEDTESIDDPEDGNDLVINQIFLPDVAKNLILSRSSVYYGYVNGNREKYALFQKAIDEILFQDLDNISYTTRPWERFVVHPSIKTNMMFCMLNGVIAYSNIPGKPYTWSNGAKEFAKIRYESNLHKCVQYLLTKLYKKIDHDTIIMEITRLVNEELRRLRNIGKMDRETASYVCDVVISAYLNNVCNDINIYSRTVSQKLHPIFKLYHLYRFVFGFIPRYPVKLNCNRFISTTCFDHLPSSDCQAFVIPEIENLLIVYKNGQVKAYDWFHQKECECEGKIIMDIDTISAPTFKSMAETL